MASGTITSRQIDRETVETVTDFIVWGSKITTDDDCSQEIKDPCSWKESYDQTRPHIKKQRHFSANKSPSSQGYGFLIVMYGCGNCTIKKAEAEELMLLDYGVAEDS